MMCAVLGALMHLLNVNFSSSSSSFVYSGLPSMLFDVDTRPRRPRKAEAEAAAAGRRVDAATAADAIVCMDLAAVALFAHLAAVCAMVRSMLESTAAAAAAAGDRI